MLNMISSFPRPKQHKYEQVSLTDKTPVFDQDESDEEEDFIQKQIRLQREQLKKQDEGLEMLSQQATRLGQLSLAISEEMTYQSRFVVRYHSFSCEI
jgi:K+/H+ antiporter YhaU regulatory subunit KhtT